jgi:hypothetical protein
MIRLSSRSLKWFTLGIILLVTTLMAAVVMKEWDTLITFSWHLDVKYLILTITLHSFALGVTFLVWHLMIKRLGKFDNRSLNFRFYYISTLAKRIPTALWYVGGRLAMYQRVGVSVPVVLSCLVLENVIVGIAGISTFLALLPLYSRIPSMGLGLFALASLGIVSIIGLLAKPQAIVNIINWTLERLGRQKLDISPTRGDIFLWGGLYILPWLSAGLSLYCATQALSDSISLEIVDAIGISTLSMLVALLSMIFPSGLGLKELTSSVLLSHWMPLSSAIVISISYRLIQTVNEVIWALAARIFFIPAGSNLNNSKELFTNENFQV